MLVELADEISDTVADLFNKSLMAGEVPPDWKLANVTPIFKKEKKSSVSNYRPVSRGVARNSFWVGIIFYCTICYSPILAA